MSDDETYRPLESISPVLAARASNMADLLIAEGVSGATVTFDRGYDRIVVQRERDGIAIRFLTREVRR